MEQNFVYLDNSATTKPCDSAIKKLNTALIENWGNPSSLHTHGVNAEIAVSDVRDAVAKMLGCKQKEIYFTSGGTEANNIAIFGAARAMQRRGKKIITTAVEHSSVLEPFKALGEEGFEVVYIKPNFDGNISIESFENAIDKDTVLVSSMLVNNETGAIFPVEKIKKIITDKGSPALLHCDCVQAFGKIPVTVKGLGADLITLSAHKIHGIKGTGVLYKSEKANIRTTVFGGGQESGLRSGTEAVPGIAALGGALEEITVEKSYQKVLQLNLLMKKLLGEIDGIVFNSPENALPYILNISVPGYRSETLLHFLEREGVFVSSGSACSKGQGSYVLNEMRLSRPTVDSALRISFSKDNTEQDVIQFVDALKKAKQKLYSAKHK